MHSAPAGGGSGQQGLGSGQLCRMTVPGLLSRMMLFVLPLALPWAGTAAAKDPSGEGSRGWEGEPCGEGFSEACRDGGRGRRGAVGDPGPASASGVLHAPPDRRAGPVPLVP
ncbi:hypothetical protein Stsp01_55780 [Streptomyces sp. NBRC 13847]|nr:hypothetical protein Stsp01_55780 [Streptomyces sp. NBRC 13847]